MKKLIFLTMISLLSLNPLFSMQQDVVELEMDSRNQHITMNSSPISVNLTIQEERMPYVIATKAANFLVDTVLISTCAITGGFLGYLYSETSHYITSEFGIECIDTNTLNFSVPVIAGSTIGSLIGYVLSQPLKIACRKTYNVYRSYPR